MILKSFLLGNLVSLCMKIINMKIINSVVVVGLYYGFLTTFSIGPSYLFLLRARVMEKEEGTEKRVSATTGFITGQLMMFISIYYAPLHLALDKPHTITVLVVPYLLFHFFWNEEIKYLFDYTNRNSIRNLGIQCVFLNNLILQLFNQFLLPSSTLSRLVNVYMFRCNKKMLFVTSSFVGWLIGHIFFMKWVGLVLFWIRKMNSIRSNKYIRFCKYYVSELIDSKDQLFVIIFLITGLSYLGRMPSPAFIRRVKHSEELIEWLWWQGKGRRPDQYILWFEKRIVTILFDFKQWNRPLRYIKNDNFEKPVINEMSQYFFDICPSSSYEKRIISFTHPPSLSTFFEMMQRKFKYSRGWKEKKKIWKETKKRWKKKQKKRKRPARFSIYYRYFFLYKNKKKTTRLLNEFKNRIKALGKGALPLDVLEKRTRLCINENEQKCLPKVYDPFLSGPYRKKAKEGYSFEIGEDEKMNINGFYSILAADFPELVDATNIMLMHQIIENMFITRSRLNPQATLRRSLGVGIKRFTIKLLRWSHNLNTISQEQDMENAEDPTDTYSVLLRRYKRLVIYREDDENISAKLGPDGELEEQDKEIALLNYTKEPDSARDLIKGAIRAQRRKTAVLGLYQLTVQSPLFLDRMDGLFFRAFAFDISEIMKKFFSNRGGKGPKFEVSTSDSENEKEKVKYKEAEETFSLAETDKEKKDAAHERAVEDAQDMFGAMLEIGFWDVVLALQGSRGLALLAQSFFRKYILLPSIVIAKNLVRTLFLQTPEWSEDWRDWKGEIHIKCTYSGVQISDTEFPDDWLMDGIQIKVLFPFHPKPWRRSKLRSRHRDPMKEKKRNADRGNKIKSKKKNSFYLTIWGGGLERPFGRRQKRPSFWKPIWKELKKRIRKEKKKKLSLVRIRALIRSLIGRSLLLQRILGILEEKIRWIQKSTLFINIKEKIKEFAKENPIFLFPLGSGKVYEPHENRKDSILSKKIKEKSIIRIRSVVSTNYSLIENEMKHFANRTTIIREKIESITKEKRKIFLTPDINISSPNETGCDDKRSESQKHIWQILRRKSVRLIRKWHYFIKSFIERIYMDIFLCTINISRIHAQLFLESKKKMINKNIENIEKNNEGIDETNQNPIDFISTLEKSLSNISNIRKEKSRISWDLSSLSQAYVFYNLSQTQAINKYHLRSVLQDRGAHLLFKDRIKDYLWTLGILDAKSSPKRIPNSGMNEWKNWLRGHYQYNFSQTRWSRLVPQKWRNKVSKHRTSQNKESKKDSYEKDQPIHYEKQKNHVMNSLPIQKEKFKKNYRYDLLSHKYIHYENKKDSYSYIFIVDTDKNIGRKYLKWEILYDFNRKNIGIKTRTNIDTETNINKNTKTGTNNYQIIDKKDLFSLTIHQERNPSNQKNFFDWMGMNEEMLYRSIANLETETWFFSELVRLSSAYKSNPRIIPIKLLVLNYEYFSKNKSISKKKKRYLDQLSKKKKRPGQKNLGSYPGNQQKDLEKDYTESDIKKRKRQLQFHYFLKKYLLSQLNLHPKFNRPVNTGIRVYCFLLKMMRNPKEIALYSIRIEDIRVDMMEEIWNSIFPVINFPEVIKRGIVTIDPIRLFIKLDGQSIMYQTIGISLVHKNKHQTNQRCREKKYDLLVPENIPSPRRRRELRIRFCFNCRIEKVVDGNPLLVNGNNIRNCVHFLDEDKHIDTDRNKLIQFKLFLWPNYRLEDLACMNRYWFDTHNGSRFSMSRIHMYPRFRIS